MLHLRGEVRCGVRRTITNPLDKETHMTDPNTTDNPETRTWERMDIPERDGDRDPFTYFTGDGPGDDLDI